MKKPKLGAIIVGVESIEQMLPFYQNVFGVVVKEQSEHYCATDFNGILLEIEEDSPNRTKGWKQHHVGTFKNTEIEVEDIDAFCRLVLTHGGRIVSEPKSRPWGTRGAEIADPQGNVFPIQEPIKSNQ